MTGENRTLTPAERAEVRAAVSNIVYRYAECIDLGDFEGMAALFARATYRAVTPDGIMTIEGAEPVLALQNAMVHKYDGIPSTKHVTTNLIVDVAADGSSATCRSYYTVLQARPEIGLQPIIAGRYHDRFEHDGDPLGEWHLADRLIFTDLLGDLSQHLKMPIR